MAREQGRVMRRPIYRALCALLCICATNDALGATTTTTITYDAGDHVASVKDPRALVTSYSFDGLGQLWQQVSPDTGTTSYGYDAYGRRSSMTRADGVVTTYGYDGLNRVTSISAGGQTQSFTYDSCTNGIGRLCSASDSTGTTSYSYTPEGWVAGRGFSIEGATYALGYAYDAMGHLSVVSYPDGNQAIYGYTDGAVSDVTLKVGGVSLTGAGNITYRPGNLAMSGWTSSNGLSNILTYDNDGRLTGIDVPNIQSLAFAYDEANRISATANGIDPSQSLSYNYDDQSRLTAAYGVGDNEKYNYDLNGNRTSQVVNGAQTNFVISPTSNRLMSVSGSSSESYGYDSQGNLNTINGASYFQYNSFNRLASSEGVTDYVNPQGRRLRKSGQASTKYFAPEADFLMAENAQGAWVDYVWLNGRLVGRVSEGRVYAVHGGPSGRPQVVTEERGAPVWKANNLPFSRIVVLDDIGGLNIGFPGQYYDVDRGTWNNGYRDYNANLGRYIQSDPIGLAGGTNTYVYARSNPLLWVDPNGLDVTITIQRKGYSSTGNSLAGTISAASDRTSVSFSGYTMENAHAGDNGDKGPIPSGVYDAFVRHDHNPNRLELEGVPGYQNIQIHNGSYPRNFKGCFGVGTSQRTDFLGGSKSALNSILGVVSADGTGNITVEVLSPPASPYVPFDGSLLGPGS